MTCAALNWAFSPGGDISIDDVEDCVHLPSRVLKALGLEVDHRVGPELAGKCDVVGGCGRHDPDARPAGKLHRMRASYRPNGSIAVFRLFG